MKRQPDRGCCCFFCSFPKGHSGHGLIHLHVERWQSGSMVVRWVSAAIVEAEKRFRRVRDYRQIAKLMKALETFEAEDEAAAWRVA